VIVIVGVLIGRGLRHERPPLVIERTTAAPAQNSSAVPPPIVSEEIYICGARTKKGTPCSRRVHGPTRCWQHKGLPAMLPQEKLKIKE
jgi:hypothetical protein